MLRYNARQRVLVLEVADVTAFSEFVFSLVPSKCIGFGTRILITPADYGDREAMPVAFSRTWSSTAERRRT